MNATKKFYALAGIMALLTALETHLMNYSTKGGDQSVPSILALLSGFGIGIIAMFRIERPAPVVSKKAIYIPLGLFTLVLLNYSIIHSIDMFNSVPVDYHIADPLPIMEVMSKRFLEGSNVYAVIPEIWEGMLPIYLPTMYLPYVFSSAGHFDPRWIDLIFMQLAVFIPIFYLRKGMGRTWIFLLVIPLSFLLFKQFIEGDNRLLGMSDEGVVVGWTVFLAVAIWSRKPWLIGAMITCCVLARLSIIGWILGYAIYVFRFENSKKAINIAVVATALGFFLMWVTGALYNLQIFLDLPRRYMEAIQSDNFDSLNETIQGSLGMAKFFTYSGLFTLHKISQASTFVVPLILLWIYQRYKAKFDPVLYPIAMLKICLLVFFNLLIIPVHNLFLTLPFLSLAIFAFYTLSPTQVKKGNTNPAGSAH